MRYGLKKFVVMLVTLLLISFLVFVSFRMISGDPATSMLGMNATKEAVESLREEMGLNDPVLIQYGRWLFAFLQGDMGISYSYGMPVSQMIQEKIPINLSMTALAFLLVLAISIPLGIYTARKEGGWVDRVVLVSNQVVMAIPPFFLGILMTFFFGQILHLFTPGGYVSYDVSWIRFLGYLCVPAVAIALPKCAMTVKLLRSSILEQSKLEYVRTAYSRGNNTSQVLYRHILQNALIPTVTFLGMVLSDMLAGSIIVEQVFGIPGLGRILLTSISNRDYPVVQAIIVLIACFVVGINFLVDLLYPILDPRMKE